MNGCSDGSCGPPAIGLRPAGGFAPCWIVDLGTIGLTRVPTGAQTVVTDGLQNPLLGSQDLNSGWRFGPWLDVTRQFDCWGLEFLYFSVDGFSDGASFGGTVLSPLFPAVNLDSLNLAYSSRLYNGEINATTALAKHINLLAGFRWIQLDEELDGIGTAGAQFGTATQTVSTNLYGFQLGAEGHLLDDRGPWRLSAFAKAGVYGAHSAGVFNATFGPGSMQVAESDNHVAFVGETGVNLAYHVCSHVSLFAGYEALWIDGVSLAPDTLANGALTQTTAFYHGATAGLEFRW
jgi:hypothetical protein